MQRPEIIAKLQALKPHLAKSSSVKTIAIFGSAARNELRPDSDIDIVVDFEHSPGFFALADLEEHLRAELGHPVDVFTPASLHPLLRDRILKEAVYA
jgi:uncharacterized protein